jgi:hypothetical protein
MSGGVDKNAAASVNECAICLDPVAGGDVENVRDAIARTPCGHEFHASCLHKYAVVQPNPFVWACPICRGAVIADHVSERSLGPTHEVRSEDHAAVSIMCAILIKFVAATVVAGVVMAWLWLSPQGSGSPGSG